MRTRWWTAGAAVALAAAATAAEIDFTDFDDVLMRDMDDAIQELDSNVSGGQREAALANAAVLRDGLAWVEQYFANKPEAPRGAGLAREGSSQLAAAVVAIEAGDFEAAGTAVRGLVRSCKACHQAYKPAE